MEEARNESDASRGIPDFTREVCGSVSTKKFYDVRNYFPAAARYCAINGNTWMRGL